jgi:hypothetical protein
VERRRRSAEASSPSAATVPGIDSTSIAVAESLVTAHEVMSPAAMSVTDPTAVLDGAVDGPGAPDPVAEAPAVGVLAGPVRVEPRVAVAIAV